jgi:hypothetical protein
MLEKIVVSVVNVGTRIFGVLCLLASVFLFFAGVMKAVGVLYFALSLVLFIAGVLFLSFKLLTDLDFNLYSNRSGRRQERDS